MSNSRRRSSLLGLRWRVMANRTMQQKVLKMKRQRRAWAKTLSRRGYMQPNRDVINEYKHHAQGLEVDEARIDEAVRLMRVKDGETNPQKREFDAEPRLDALRKQAELEAILPDGCDFKFSGPTVPDMYQETFIYFNSKKTKFVLVLRDLEQKIERTSVVFSSKELLMLSWEMDMVYWDKKRPI